MRIWIALAAATALAACSGSDETANNSMAADNLTAPVPTPAAMTTIPQAFHGSFDANAVSCAADSSEMRLVIAAGTMRFWESESRVTAVTPVDEPGVPQGAIDVDAVSTGEGITEERRYRLAMGEDGRLSVTNRGSTAQRVRCNAPEAASAMPAQRIPVNLAPDGLMLVDPASGRSRLVTFDMPRAETLSLVRAGLGEPSETGTCEAAPLDYARFGDAMSLTFENGRFVGWSADPRAGTTLATASGVRIGSTRAEMEESIAIEVSNTSLGTEFNSGGLAGVLSGTGANARVEALWAGMTCIAR